MSDEGDKISRKKITGEAIAETVIIYDVVELDLIGSDDVDGHIHLVISD